MNSIKKVVLAYSGGLDTSVILKWLQEKYDCEVVTFTADIGQGEEIEPAREKAKQAGIKEIYIENLEEDFAKNYISQCLEPMLFMRVNIYLEHQ
jgi:argininosuccinate synthase